MFSPPRFPDWRCVVFSETCDFRGIVSNPLDLSRSQSRTEVVVDGRVGARGDDLSGGHSFVHLGVPSELFGSERVDVIEFR
jgi:hypothetical protein